jgi:uncharacterized membrane protein
MRADEPGLPLPGPAANDPGPPALVMPGRRVRAGAGAQWVGDGWRLFRQAKLMWIVILVLLFLVHLGLGMVPVVGVWIPNLVSPILAGGIVLGCRSLETGGELELEHLLAGFRRNTGLLFAIGLVYTAGQLVILGAFSAVAGTSFAWAAIRGDEAAILESLPDDPLRLALAGLVAAALAIPLVAAYWFAPALAMMHDVPAIPAMKESFFASFRNFVPMLVYGLLMAVLAVVAVIPLGLGLLVWVPVLIASTYASYRSVFTEEDGEAG